MNKQQRNAVGSHSESSEGSKHSVKVVVVGSEQKGRAWTARDSQHNYRSHSDNKHGHDHKVETLEQMSLRESQNMTPGALK